MSVSVKIIPDKKTRVLLADDHALFRQTTRALLERDGFDVVGEAVDGVMAEQMVKELLPDVVILDIGMPGINGIEVAKSIRREMPDIFIIVLSVHDEEIYMVEALQAGAHGYVLKTQSDSDLTQAIKAVALGAIYLAPGISNKVISNITSNSPSTREELSVRERQVLEMVSQGKTTKQIAVVLNLSPKTVEAIRGRIMKKLDLHHTAELVTYAVRNELLK